MNPAEKPISQPKINKNSPKLSSSPKETTEATKEKDRTQPIPPPSHPRQYRAIGLVQAKYERSEEQLTQGYLITAKGDKIEAVVLGRVISLVKNHLDMDKEHLWVVYPRTKTQTEGLHLQIVGVWEPETLNQGDESALTSDTAVEAGYFSIRGEVIFFNTEEKSLVIKIKQFPRKEGDKPKFFKLKLKGVLGERPLKHFYDLNVHLEGETLVVQDGTDLGFAQKKPRFQKKSRRPSPKGGKRIPSRKPTTTSSRPKPSIKKPSK
ncbi:MAG: hypothetical protein QNJ70_13765 [Xenococcaceae cyanobacterium MO_207.B15]|nr:hypothetical protein [Xenococcaceae cyanobacterium MO_207.B15]